MINKYIVRLIVTIYYSYTASGTLLHNWIGHAGHFYTTKLIKWDTSAQLNLSSGTLLHNWTDNQELKWDTSTQLMRGYIIIKSISSHSFIAS